MAPAEKMQELGAVVNFWKSRVSSFNAELEMLQDLRTHHRAGDNRYAADRLLREIKKKAGEIAGAELSLQQAQRNLGGAIESTGHRPLRSPPSADRGRAAQV